MKWLYLLKGCIYWRTVYTEGNWQYIVFRCSAPVFSVPNQTRLGSFSSNFHLMGYFQGHGVCFCAYFGDFLIFTCVSFNAEISSLIKLQINRQRNPEPYFWVSAPPPPPQSKTRFLIHRNHIPWSFGRPNYKRGWGRYTFVKYNCFN